MMDESEASNSEPTVYSAPRRFDLATILVVCIAYSLLFGVLRLCGAHPAIFASVAGLVTLVGIAQALFFGGKCPRLSSVIVGVVYFFAACCIVEIVGSGGWEPGVGYRPAPELFPISVVLGGSLGYGTGVAVGAVFLIADKVRKKLERTGNLSPIEENSQD